MSSLVPSKTLITTSCGFRCWSASSTSVCSKWADSEVGLWMTAIRLFVLLFCNKTITAKQQQQQQQQEAYYHNWGTKSHHRVGVPLTKI